MPLCHDRHNQLPIRQRVHHRLRVIRGNALPGQAVGFGGGWPEVMISAGFPILITILEIVLPVVSLNTPLFRHIYPMSIIKKNIIIFWSKSIQHLPIDKYISSRIIRSYKCICIYCQHYFAESPSQPIITQPANKKSRLK